jgi:type I restriction enzyme S subunit
MTGTTGRQRLSPKDLAATSLNLPPLDEQRRIVDLVGLIDEQVAGLELQIETVKELRQTLLSDLLSGSSEIPESFDELEMTV